MLEPNSSSKTFFGVRFVLFGFDPITERQVRAKLLNGGGVDVGHYYQNCTHVIVDKIVYDDPRCVNARIDGKTLVTGLWIDHSYDIGMAVDATSIMYRPPRDLNGIPGAENLVLCLTGYQRQDREDIMTMVGLMGAQFSKPLVANKVTHLICYKFEGEKYELASKLKKIKLVNHRWLEDCLRDWELLPEDNYRKSGYEMEMMEAEAKDSEEGAEDTTERQSSCKIVNKSPQLKIETSKASPMPQSIEKVLEVPHNISEPKGLQSSVKDMLSAGGESRADPASGFNSNCVCEEPAGQDIGTYIVGTSVGLPDPQERTPNSRKTSGGLESVLRSAEKSQSDAKFNAISYTRNTLQKSPSSMFLKELGSIRGSPKLQLGEPSSISSAKSGYGKDTIGSGHAEYLQGSEVLYKEAPSSKKQKIDVPYCNSKQQNISDDPQASVRKSPSGRCKTRGLDPVSLVDGLFKVTMHPLGNNDEANHDIVSPDAAQKLQTDVSGAKSSTSEKKSFTQGPIFLENMMQETASNENLNGRPPQTFSKGLRNSSLSGKPEGGKFEVEKSEHVVAEAGGLLHQQQDKQAPSPFNRKSEEKKSMEETQEGSGNLITKTGRKKMVARRTWGSKPTLKNTAKQKGTIYLNKAVAQNDSHIDLSGETAANEKFDNGNEPETLPAVVNVTAVEEAETKTWKRSEDNVENDADFVDDETEAPEDKDVSLDILDEKEAEVVDLSHKADDIKEKELEGAQHPTNSTATSTDDCMKGKDAIQLWQKDESTCKENCMKRKVCQSKRQRSGKSKKKTVPNVSEESEFKNVLDREGTCDGKNIKGKAIKKQKATPNSVEHVNRSVSGKNLGSSAEIEKENNPIADGDQNIGQATDQSGKRIIKSVKASMKIQQKAGKSNPNCTSAGEDKEQVNAEPIWFILSGHRLQRKEFQQVIRRLKGKFCRDSHQWSYQATHFIAPDPIRRTEKFFAAAASGRWILKTDYLSACSQAGRFLYEEPYEWHKNGLSEDGAINLEAPRKWRLLREKTGHGAFHAMRIIIYGECIAPPLDTLKRVVKAGDGTILATSPPYTRFLTSGVDYAIISPGMPRVDLWVQEFLRHEIPCVVADYLVEYVCKPGYSLERHVLYNTHAWAERSFAHLLSKAEEIVENLTPSDDLSDNDITCQVCGSRDRGDVMLICGDENGSAGCGVGMHIDCCDPPLENIPEDDWFCPNCSNNSSSNSNISKKRRKGNSSLKTK